jgi:CheY-like chemotaxis protein
MINYSWVPAMHALIIDDDTVVRLLASKMLESKGFAVTSLKSEEEVLSFLSSTDLATIHLILLDLQIGDCTGREMYDHLIKAFDPFPKLVFMSSNSEQEAHELGLHNDKGDGYLQKPFQAQALFDTISMFEFSQD